MNNQKKTIALTDDHVLIRGGLAALINKLDDYEVILEADNGKDLIRQLHEGNRPDIALLDVNMPELNGFETAKFLRERFPDIKVLALSMDDNEYTIIHMIQNGARGYILKDIEPKLLRSALDAVKDTGYYYSEMVTAKMFHAMNHMEEAENPQMPDRLSPKEKEFLKWASTELTYREIADKLFVSPRTIDGYRDALFEKLQIRTRVGLVLYAIRNRMVFI